MKKIVPVVIVVVCILLLLWGNLDFGMPVEDFETREVSGTEVLESNEDIPVGYYDVCVLEGPTNVGLHAMDEGEVYHNYHVLDGSQFFLKGGSGKVKVEVAERTLLQGDSFEICRMGEYEVGRDIEPGEYTITLQSELKQDNSIVLYLWNRTEDQCIETYSFKGAEDAVTMKLRKGQFLWVFRTVETEDEKADIKLGFRHFKQ